MNELFSIKTPDAIAEEVIVLAKDLQNRTTTIVSGLVNRADDYSEKATRVNEIMKTKCAENGLLFVDNSGISPTTHLNASKLHLNDYETTALCKNFINVLNSF